MVTFISSESKKIIYNCIERESKKVNIPLEKTRLVLYLKDDGSNGYRLINEVKKDGVLSIETIKEFSFTGVLGVKVDFKGYSMIAPPFIQKAILRFAERLNISYNKLNVICYPTYQKGEIAICLFNQNTYLEQIKLSDLFNEEDASQ
jgi:hypothetical protein